MAANYLYDALVDVDKTNDGRQSRVTVHRVRAKIGRTEAGQLVAEHDDDQWDITEAEIVRRFHAPLVLSAELTAELRKHGVGKVVVNTVQVEGGGLVPDTDTKVQLHARSGSAPPSMAAGHKLTEAILSEMEPQIDSEPGTEEVPVYGWSFKID